MAKNKEWTVGRAVSCNPSFFTHTWYLYIYMYVCLFMYAFIYVYKYIVPAHPPAARLPRSPNKVAPFAVRGHWARSLLRVLHLLLIAPLLLLLLL
ncbi:hypothetical protein T492DRAFT_923846 [Pavlovales sp. CCMP2436]|nr:hypothetical protein T492DRAFT_923846 [Pavlovales sp. CCMP2436]